MYGYRTALAMMGLWLAACSGVKQEDFDAELAEAMCEKYVRCGVSYDKDSCKRGQLEGLIGLYGLNTYYSATLQAGRMLYDAEAAKACLEKIRTGSCDQPPLSTRLLLEGVGASAECRVLLGQLEDGERCKGSGECGPRSFCPSRSPEPCGICQPRLGEGMTSPSFRQCEEGLVSINSICRKPLGEGQACGDSGVFELGPCAPGLFCDLDTKVCRRPASLGQSCDVSKVPCHWNLACIEGTCQALRDKGNVCTARSTNVFTQGDCKQELFCDADPNAPGKCRELLGEGSSCRNDRECDRGLYCDGKNPDSAQRGTCRRLAQQDEDCSGRVCAGRFICVEPSRTCHPGLRFDQLCAS